MNTADVSVVQQEKKHADNMGKVGGRRGFTQYVKFEDGINEMREFPVMDGTSPYVPYCTCSLEVEVDKYENGKVVGKEIKDKKIFDAAVHSNVMGGKTRLSFTFVMLRNWQNSTKTVRKRRNSWPLWTGVPLLKEKFRGSNRSRVSFAMCV